MVLDMLYNLFKPKDVSWDFSALVKQSVRVGYNNIQATEEWLFPKQILLRGDILQTFETLRWASEKDGMHHAVGFYGSYNDYIMSDLYSGTRGELWTKHPKLEVKLEADKEAYDKMYVIVLLDGVEKMRKHIFRSEYSKHQRYLYPAARIISVPPRKDEKTGQTINYSFFSYNEIRNLCYQNTRHTSGIVCMDRMFLAVKTAQTSLLEKVLTDEAIPFTERLKIMRIVVYRGTLEDKFLTRIV